MFEFIPTIRTDRNREIKKYKDKGFTFIKENDYKLISKVYIPHTKNTKMFFEVRVDFSEVRFYIIKSGASIYLTIYQLYVILYNIQLEGKIVVVNELEKLLKTKKFTNFFYCDIEYKIPSIKKFDRNHKVYIPYSDIKVDFNELLYLLVLIQEKSNYLCSLSESKKEFSNGIIRLLISLLSIENNCELLNRIGWFWNADEKKYNSNELTKIYGDYDNKASHNKLVERKYYLTEYELDSIIKLES